MNRESGKPVFDENVNEILAGKIVSHTEKVSANATIEYYNENGNEAKTCFEDRCCGKHAPILCIIAAGILLGVFIGKMIGSRYTLHVPLSGPTLQRSKQSVFSLLHSFFTQ
jgi:hypothetical protein